MVKDITGFKFNKLTVIEYSHKKGRVHYWVCDIIGKIWTLLN
jgi:hypothetical protein